MRRLVFGFALLIAGFLVLGDAQALVLSPDSDYSISIYEVLLVLHVLLFVFWLGPDIGVYAWSMIASSTAVTPNMRVTAGKMMHIIEFMPKVCIALMLTVGGILTENVGLAHASWQWIAILSLGPVWLLIVVVAYFREGTAFGETVSKADLLLRWVVVVSVIASTTYSIMTGRLDPAPWVAGKLYLFAAIVFLGLMMRRHLEPFLASLKRLETEEPNDEINGAISASMGRARLFMFGIWACLLVAAWMGVSQPGSSDSAAPVTGALTVNNPAQEG